MFNHVHEITLLIFLFYSVLEVLFFNNKEKVNDTVESTAAVKKIILKDSGEGKILALLSIDAENENDSELVELWKTIRNDRQKHVDMLRDALKKKFSK